MAESMRDVSKRLWNASEEPTYEQINTGSLQRIADATEKMAANYDKLRADRDWWKGRAEANALEITRLTNVARSLRGVITRLRNSGGTNQ